MSDVALLVMDVQNGIVERVATMRRDCSPPWAEP